MMKTKHVALYLPAYFFFPRFRKTFERLISTEEQDIKQLTFNLQNSQRTQHYIPVEPTEGDVFYNLSKRYPITGRPKKFEIKHSPQLGQWIGQMLDFTHKVGVCYRPYPEYYCTLEEGKAAFEELIQGTVSPIRYTLKRLIKVDNAQRLTKLVKDCGLESVSYYVTMWMNQIIYKQYSYRWPTYNDKFDRMYNIYVGYVSLSKIFNNPASIETIFPRGQQWV